MPNAGLGSQLAVMTGNEHGKSGSDTGAGDEQTQLGSACTGTIFNYLPGERASGSAAQRGIAREVLRLIKNAERK